MKEGYKRWIAGIIAVDLFIAASDAGLTYKLKRYREEREKVKPRLYSSYVFNQPRKTGAIMEVERDDHVPEIMPLEYRLYDMDPSKLDEILFGNFKNQEISTVPVEEKIEVSTTPVEEKIEESTTPVEETTQEEPVETQTPEERTIEVNKTVTKPHVINDLAASGYILNETKLYAGATELSLDIGTLHLNDSAIRILSEANGWDLVRTKDNRIGFVRADDVEYSTRPMEQPYNLELVHDVAVTTSAVNFRVEPNTNCKILRTIEPRMELQVIGETEDGWLLVQLNDEVGFVSKDYTYSLLEKLHEEYPNIDIDNLGTEFIVEVTSPVRLRKGPDTDYDVIRELEKSEIVRVIGETDDWYLGMTDDYEFGFVNKGYTERLEGSFINTDISQHRTYVMNENQVWLYTRVNTGAPSTPTSKGHFNIFYMEENHDKGVNIVGNTYVTYWMHYYNGEGIHDYPCVEYGEGTYLSHGCTRTPMENVAKIYQRAYIGMPVIVHR